MSFELNFCLLLLGVMYIHVAAGEWENDEAGQPKDNEGDDIRPRHFRYRGSDMAMAMVLAVAMTVPVPVAVAVGNIGVYIIFMCSYS